MPIACHVPFSGRSGAFKVVFYVRVRGGQPGPVQTPAIKRTLLERLAKLSGSRSPGMAKRGEISENSIRR